MANKGKAKAKVLPADVPLPARRGFSSDPEDCAKSCIIGVRYTDGSVRSIEVLHGPSGTGSTGWTTDWWVGDLESWCRALCLNYGQDEVDSILNGGDLSYINPDPKRALRAWEESEYPAKVWQDISHLHDHMMDDSRAHISCMFIFDVQAGSTWAVLPAQKPEDMRDWIAVHNGGWAGCGRIAGL